MADKEFEQRLARFRKLPMFLRVVVSRPRTFVALAIALVAFFLMPESLRLATRALVGWDVFAAIYLMLAHAMMLRSGHEHIRPSAILQDDGRFLIMVVTQLAALASIAAIVFELGASKNAAGLMLAVATIALSWALVHTSFALHYAHDYYRDSPGGLQFPSGSDGKEKPDYWDFVYFSFVIGMTAQVSDVGITSKTIRRTATVHGIISFVFNTALLALMVNIAASAF